ncbi:TMAO reductase system periplasmic protein TorT [Vibrio sp. 10N.286.49.B3]|uniref:TMAO reductase system periplasmic protein TorT n=1 Tax=Vibrio sp. 10N.286.49.B3 TaxID=1880855 RepID=UPI000C82B5E0|nr:TMAO reductase system periplasmic protein TorT [Vibrio sp. 10N.286.49.B3]
MSNLTALLVRTTLLSLCLWQSVGSLFSSAYATESPHVIANPYVIKSPYVIKKAPAKICALYPHLKDSYWLSVNYGMVSEAKQQGVELRVLEAGGYPNKDKQIKQLKLCRQWQADAIILGTVDPQLYNDQLSELIGDIPLFSAVNDLELAGESIQQLKGVIGVDWYLMGFKSGQYLADRHPKGSGITNIVLLPGPQSSGGTKPTIQGFHDAIKNSDIKVIQSQWADNDKELQRNILQEFIHLPDLKYVVGGAVAIEVAISELRTAKKSADIGLVATYFSHGVYRGLLRNKVEFAPSDQMVKQGRLAIIQAAHYLRNETYQNPITLEVKSLTPTTLEKNIITNSLSPSGYRPIFNVSTIEKISHRVINN